MYSGGQGTVLKGQSNEIFNLDQSIHQSKIKNVLPHGWIRLMKINKRSKISLDCSFYIIGSHQACCHHQERLTGWLTQNFCTAVNIGLLCPDRYKLQCFWPWCCRSYLFIRVWCFRASLCLLWVFLGMVVMELEVTVCYWLNCTVRDVKRSRYYWSRFCCQSGMLFVVVR